MVLDMTVYQRWINGRLWVLFCFVLFFLVCGMHRNKQGKERYMIQIYDWCFNFYDLPMRQIYSFNKSHWQGCNRILKLVLSQHQYIEIITKCKHYVCISILLQRKNINSWIHFLTFLIAFLITFLNISHSSILNFEAEQLSEHPLQIGD